MNHEAQGSTVTRHSTIRRKPPGAGSQVRHPEECCAMSGVGEAFGHPLPPCRRTGIGGTGRAAKRGVASGAVTKEYGSGQLRDCDQCDRPR